MKLLTFTVPCYNSQDYMRRCVDSLLIGGEDVEIIIVDDGSSDDTGAIADAYAEKYPSIVRAIHQENGGHGAGLNAGLNHATGLYFKVVDSDDWVIPGRVFRSDSDATHSPMFHQMEGLVVDKGITLGDLQGALNTFVQKLFGKDTRTRLRPSYFPFTEPSVEVDVSCFECGGKGCPLCKHTGWIEVLGGGVVNRKVLENCNIDPDEYSGFAFGIGIERIAMLKYGINNIGLMFENNLQFLKQFHE